MSSWVLAACSRSVIRTLGLGLALVGLGGCARSFRLDDTPPGFIVVEHDNLALRMTAPDGVELWLSTSDNTYHDSLAEAAALNMISPRQLGYVLIAQTPVVSANGVNGTRFDFSHTPSRAPDRLEGITEILFVTDEWEVVINLYGELDQLASHDEDIDRMLAGLEIRGCKKGRNTVCQSPQPKQYPLGNLREPIAELSDEEVCAHMGDILRRRLETDHPSKAPSPADLREFMAECTASFAGRKAGLGPGAAAALTECVMAAGSVEALTRCGRPRITDDRVCDRVSRIDPGKRSEVYGECRDALDAARIEPGPLAVDEMSACVLAASTMDELARCKY